MARSTWKGATSWLSGETGTGTVSRGRRGVRSRASVHRRRLALEALEERVTPSSDCYASLFAGPRLVSVDSRQSEILEGVFNAILPGNYVDLAVADWNAIATGQ